MTEAQDEISRWDLHTRQLMEKYTREGDLEKRKAHGSKNY